MQSDDIFGPMGHRGNRINILIGGIGRQNCTRFTDAVQLRKYFLFQIRIFEHCLNDQVRVG